MDLAIIGNCRYNALIDSKGTLKWLCWPRFDSSFVFGSLLDPKGGHFSINGVDVLDHSQSYLPNSNVLRTVIHEKEGSFEIIDFAPRFVLFERMHAPSQLYRIVRPISGHPKIRIECSPTYDYGEKKLEVCTGSNHLEYSGAEAKLRLTTNAPLAYVQEGKEFLLQKPIYMALTWGKPLESDLEETAESFLKRTLHYWQKWVKHCRIPRSYQAPVIRSALVLKLHQYEDTGAITAASTTSLPEYQDSTRNWDYRYCWLRDAYFSLEALDKLGHFEETEKFVDYLHNIALFDENDHLQPVYSVLREAQLTEKILDHLEGYKKNKPVRVGNQAFEHIQNDIYGEMILALSPLFLDRRFLIDREQLQWPLLSKLLGYIEKHIEEEDAGLWEFRGRQDLHAFSVLFHWLGSKRCRTIAERFKNQDWLNRADAVMKKSQSILDNELWDEKRSCYVQGKEHRHLDASLLALINLGYLDPKSDRAKSHLKALEKELLSPNGFVYRYKKADDFGVPEVSFVICSYWYVEALAKVGESERARELFEHYLDCANHVGLMSEDLHPDTKEQWGNFPQTYSHVGLINAAFALDQSLD